jgi:hypothetical protein
MIMMPYADAGHRCRSGERHSSGTSQGAQKSPLGAAGIAKVPYLRLDPNGGYLRGRAKTIGCSP